MVFLPIYCLDYKCLAVTYTLSYCICRKSYSGDPRLDFFKSDAHVGWLSPSFDAHNKLVCLSLSVNPSLIFMSGVLKLTILLWAMTMLANCSLDKATNVPNTLAYCTRVKPFYSTLPRLYFIQSDAHIG
jgi:hypothetical protein